ncbi:MAG: sulfite exporter TauE/SafE family protein [Gammaproteobacteria bacterium]|nr:sulfite exporter TauE/SafE family protein [Gammaproteobacteria bacterium]
MFLTILIVSLMVGAVAGLINGLLGGGVGLVLVPALVWIFSLEHVPHEILMQMAVGTGVTSIVISAIIATFSHHNHGTIDWSICKKMFLPIVFGVLMGSLIANHLPTLRQDYPSRLRQDKPTIQAAIALVISPLYI